MTPGLTPNYLTRLKVFESDGYNILLIPVKNIYKNGDSSTGETVFFSKKSRKDKILKRRYFYI